MPIAGVVCAWRLLRFQPQINENSRAIVKEMREFQGENRDFVTRQENMQKVCLVDGWLLCLSSLSLSLSLSLSPT